MKNLALASIVAITAVLPFGAPAQAASATRNDVEYVFPGWFYRPYYGPLFSGDGPYYRYRLCHFEVVRQHRDGLWWAERVRVCP